MNGFIRGCGGALLLGGAMMILINVLATPLLPRQQGSASVMSSGIFLIRQSASGAAALLLLFGCLGLHLAQRRLAGAYGTVAFLVLFTGSVCLFAVEWANVFVLSTVARLSPDTLSRLDKNAVMNGGFASAAGLLAVGWLLMVLSLLRTRVLPRWAALTTLAGLFTIPLLQATPLGLVGGIAGNVIFGTGMMGLGWALARGSFEGQT